MKTNPIQVTFLHGRPIVAYLQLSDAMDRRALRTEELEPGLVVDFGRGGEPLGLEIVDPPRATLAAVNRVLRRLKRGKVTSRDLRPLHVS
jgi:hypothetical protein